MSEALSSHTATQMIRFTVSGALVVGTDMGMYLLLQPMMPSALAKGISFTAGGVLGYLLNKMWTFESQGQSANEVGRFVIANTLALVVNIGINQLILYFYPERVRTALIIATALTAIFTFVVFKWWVFRK